MCRNRESLGKDEDVSMIPAVNMPKVVVCQADHSLVEAKLTEAARNGCFLFITHIERASTSVMERLKNLKPWKIGDDSEFIHKDFRYAVSTTTLNQDLRLCSAMMKMYVGATCVACFTPEHHWVSWLSMLF